jgi:cellulose synthase/poly-beta-1,6-N-acetylglucosamine synthase-like glycosyltransferase
MNLTVIIPVYNEEKTIAEIVRRVKSTGAAAEIVIVDDGSNPFKRMPSFASSCMTATRAKAPRYAPASARLAGISVLSRMPISNTTLAIILP